ncbi:MAG: ABC transporter substrate-binding protein [Chloroflexi bacterium]|nr:ABC transporter substrate-binding protein [Chloroflexota bacterium]
MRQRVESGRLLRIGLVTVVCATLLLACAPGAAPEPGPAAPQQPGSGQPKYGGVLHIVDTDDPPSLDLHQESTTRVQSIIWSAYNNLVIFDPADPNKIIPDVAQRWEAGKDGKSYTFHLHRDARFANGNALTAEDVKFSLERMKDPPKGVISPRRDALKPIQRIETPGPYTVTLVLERPYQALMPTLAQGWMAIYDKEFIEAKGQDVMKKEVMGSGAFQLKEYLRGTSIEMEKNPAYWQKGVPYLDGVKKFIIPDQGTRFAALRTGQIHMQGVDAGEATELRQTMADKIAVQRGPSIGWNTLNLNSRRKPYDDARVRQAILLAIDRNEAIKLVYQGEGVLGGYVPPSSPFALPQEELVKLPGYGADKAADRAKARQLLAEAGYANGFQTTFTVRKGSEDLAIFSQDQLKQVGIDARIVILESASAYNDATKGDFDILPWGHGLALDDPDAHYPELYLCGAPRNYSGVCDPKVDELWLRQSQALDVGERKKLVWELEKHAVPQAIKVVLGWGLARHAQWNFVKGYLRHAGSYNTTHYKQVWLDR